VRNEHALALTHTPVEVSLTVKSMMMTPARPRARPPQVAIVQAGRRCVPDGSAHAAAVEDVLRLGRSHAARAPRTRSGQSYQRRRGGGREWRWARTRGGRSCRGAVGVRAEVELSDVVKAPVVASVGETTGVALGEWADRLGCCASALCTSLRSCEGAVGWLFCCCCFFILVCVFGIVSLARAPVNGGRSAYVYFAKHQRVGCGCWVERAFILKDNLHSVPYRLSLKLPKRTVHDTAPGSRVVSRLLVLGEGGEGDGKPDRLVRR
jgi:hypothetical protein